MSDSWWVQLTAEGVLTISAPSAFIVISFSLDIRSGITMMHLNTNLKIQISYEDKQISLVSSNNPTRIPALN
jgi:hypothetical protein